MSDALASAGNFTLTECARCGAASTDPHICSECGRLLPLAAGVDYFSFFGLPRKLRIDESELEKSFYSLSRKLHPDYFMNASEEERQASIDRSSLLNDAYRTLRDKISRVQYLLTLEGYKEAEKKAPPDLLEEVFELNMQVEELKMAKKMGDAGEVAEARSALETALSGLKKKLENIDARLFALFDDWDTANGESKPTLDQMSELLSHRSYIRNLVRDIKEEI